MEGDVALREKLQQAVNDGLRLVQCGVAWPSASIAVVVLVATLSGCGQTAAGPETFAVTGIVTIDGAPVNGADIAFIPVTPTAAAVPAQAATNDKGEFEVVSVFDGGRVSKPGMLPGEYDVEIQRLESSVATLGTMQPPKNSLPPRYASAASSGLKVVVSPTEPNHFPLSLTK